ncbi:unnamed protein product [Mucor circinelloides]|nr:hypothetical protein G6F42_015133 [Rhizopus arrhizus]
MPFTVLIQAKAKNSDPLIVAQFPTILHPICSDDNGFSDPYAVLYIDGKKMGKTNVAKKTLDPVWNFHAYIPLQTDKPISLIEIFVWDKDKITEMKLKDILMIKKDAIQDDFLGKISIPYSQLFNLIHPSGKSLDYDSPDNKEVVLALEKRSVDDNVSGEIQIKFGLAKI